LSGGATAFATTTDTAAYVPYADAERVLASLEEWACDAERPMRVLRGPQGSGKSMLLAVFAARVGRHAVPVRFSANGLDPETLARTVLDALGTPWEGTPRVALVRAVEQPGTRRVLLLLDDADALAPRTEMWLFDFVRRSAGAVHALLAVRDERLAAEFANAFQSGTTVLALDAPMSREEADAWVRAELARSGADAALRARFDAPMVSRLHTRSGGLPGRLRQEAAAMLAEFALVEAPAPRLATATAAERPPTGPLGAHAVNAAAPPRPPGPRRESALRETPVALREPASPRAAAPAPAREPSAPRAASAAVTDAAPISIDPTRFDVDSKALPRGARRRDSLLRWLLVPAALAAAYIVGFLTSQVLDALRPGAAPGVAQPSVSAAPPRQVESAAAPQPPPAAAATAPAMAAPVGNRVAVAAPPAAESATPDAVATAPATTPPAVSAAPPPVAQIPARDASTPQSLSKTAPTAPAVAALAGDSAEAAASPVAPEAATIEPATAPELAPPAVSAAAPPARVRRPPAPRPPPLPRSVEVSVEAEPGASILVNGQPVGSGTVKGLQLAPGPQLVEVRLLDGRVVERIINVKGTRYDVKVR